MQARVKAFLDQYNLRKELATAGIVLVAALAIAAPTRAGIPVIDGSRLTQAVQQAAQMVQQVAAEANKITELTSKYQELIRKYQAMTGARGMGAVARGAIETDAPQWFPVDVRDAFADYHAGAVSGVLSGEVADFKARFMPLQESDFLYPTSQRQSIAGYEQATAMTGIAHGAATQALQDVDVVSQRLADLGAQIDGASDWKAAVDLKNRELLEANFLAMKRLQLRAVAMHQAATQDQYEWANTERAQKAVVRAVSGPAGLE